jgi:hypothetical protein
VTSSADAPWSRATMEPAEFVSGKIHLTNSCAVPNRGTAHLDEVAADVAGLINNQIRNALTA